MSTDLRADPVLPWGNQASSPPTDVAQDLGLVFGTSRIQVQWRIGPDEDDGGEPSHLVWWPATVMSRLDEVKDGEGRVACSIRYDPDTANGYNEAEEREVTFIDEHELWDLEEGEILLWRREGDLWEGQSVPEQGEAEDGTIDILSLCREEERRMRLMGHDTDTDLADMLQHLVPQERRRDVAACYRMGEEIFREEFTKFLQNKATGVVEEAEMKEVLARINARLSGATDSG